MTGEGSKEIGRDVDDSMRMFQRSRVGNAAVVPIVRPARVLLALDGSSQDDASVASAKTMRERFNTETLVLDAREFEPAPSSSTDDASANTDEISASMTRDKVDDSGEPSNSEPVNSEPVSKEPTSSSLAVATAAKISGARPIECVSTEAPYNKIVDAVKNHEVDLLIVPCPFGRPMEDVGTHSAGSVIDVLLSRCPVAMLVTRRPDQALAECMNEITLILGAECDVETRAAGWSFGLANENASITLALVIEKEQFENVRSIVEAIDPGSELNVRQFRDALTKTHQTLHESMAKTAGESNNIDYRLTPMAGHAAPPLPLESEQRQLLVMPIEVDDRFQQGFVQDRIRRSPHPVLVVPGHVVP